MGFGEFIFKLVMYALLGGYFLSSSAKALDEKRYFSYGTGLMFAMQWIVFLVITCIRYEW